MVKKLFYSAKGENPMCGCGIYKCNKKKLTIVLFILFLFSFTSCVRKNTENSENNTNGSYSEPKIETEQLVNTNEFSSIISVTSEDGTYILEMNNADGSYNIHYMDYKSNCDVYLCSSPNCSHDDLSCTSFIPANCGGVMLAYNNGQLIEVILGNKIDTPAQIYVMDKAGGNKKLIKTFSPEETVDFGYTISYVLSDENIYLMTEKSCTENGEVYMKNELIKVSLSDGNTSVIMEMDSPTFFVGVRDNKILMKELHGQINYIIEVDPVSGSKEIVMQYNGGHILPFEYDNQLYMLDFERHSVYKNDQVDNPLVTFEFNGSNSLSGIRVLKNSRMIIDNSSIYFDNGNYITKYEKYCLNLSDGNVQSSSLTIDKNGKEALPWIYGMFGDKLLIDVGCHIEKKYGFNSQTGEMEEYESEIPDYGVITADNLFSNNLEYDTVTLN